MSIRAVVFAHHDVGVRCLLALHSAGVEMPLVFAHEPVMTMKSFIPLALP